MYQRQKTEEATVEYLTFQQLKDRRAEWKSAVIVFTENSFSRLYPLDSRSYLLTDNSMWGLDDTKEGRRITGSSLDGVDIDTRLDWYMFGQADPEDNWKVAYCYIVEYV